MYEIKYGLIKTKLKLISLDMDSSALCNNFFNKGSFGEVLKFQISGKEQYALKNIKYQRGNPNEIDKILQEVLMAKILSALEVGPKFVQLFSYDAIVFRNHVQYAMEMCRT